MNVGTLYAQLVLTTSAFDQALTGAGARLRSFGATVTQAGRDMLVLTAPLAAVGGAAIQTGMHFESSFAKIEGLVGITGDDLAKLKQRVIELAGQTAKSPNELAEALYYLTSSGLSAAESSEVLEIAAKGSTVGLGTTQVVAKAAAFAINAYRDSGMTAAHATDILTAAVKYGTIEADEMAPVMGRLLPIASNLDISYSQVAGTLAVMSRTGLDAAEAATSMSSIFSNLVKPSEAARKVLASVGLSMDELRQVASREPDGVIQVYRILNDTLNDEQFSVVVPNVRAMRGAMNFLAQDTGLVDEVMQGVYDSTGSLDHAFEVTSDTAQFQLNQTLADMQTALLSVWEEIRGPLIAALQDLSKFVKDAATWFGNLDEGTKQTIIKIGAIVVAIGPLLIVFGSLFKVLGLAVQGLGKIVGIAGSVIKVTGSMVQGFMALVESTGGVLPAIKSLITSGFTALINPVTLAVAAIGALVIGIIGVMNAAEEGKKKAHEYLDEWERSHGVMKSASDVQDATRESMQKLVDATDPFKQDLVASVALMIPYISQLKQQELQNMRVAGATEIQEEAQRRLNDELKRQRQELVTQQLDEYKQKIEDVTGVIRELGPEYVLTADDAESLAKRFGLSAEAVVEAAGHVGDEFEEQGARIDAALMSQIGPDMDLTAEKAQEMATLLGVSADEVIAHWKAMQEQTGNSTLDMGNALGDFSTKAEKAWGDFNSTAKFSMDDVKERIQTLSDRLVELDEVDLASLGPSAYDNWNAAKVATQKELDGLVAYVDSGGKELGKIMQQAEGAIKISVEGMVGALQGLATGAEDSFDAFKKAMKKNGKDDPEERIKKLTDQLDELDKVKLADLGPAALLAWAEAKTNTKNELDQLTTFVENHSDIVEDSLPEAINQSTQKAHSEYLEALGLVEDDTGDITSIAEQEAADTGAALPDALDESNKDLEDQLGDTESDVGDTYADIADDAEDSADDTASSIPDSLNQNTRSLGTALDLTKRIIELVFQAINTMAGTYGTNTGASYVNNMASRIRDGRQQIDNAVNYATASLQAHSPPEVGPLKNIDKMGQAMARAWHEPFTAELRSAGIFDMISPEPMLARLNAAASPALAVPAVSAAGDQGRMGGVSITQHITGITPDEVERQTRRALRREAFGPGWND